MKSKKTIKAIGKGVMTLAAITLIWALVATFMWGCAAAGIKM